MNNQSIGQLGEEYAIKFLQTQDLQYIDRNFHCRLGEIDLIIFDYSTSEIAFVEVKTRTNNSYGTSTESITHHKRQNLIKSSLTYLNIHPSLYQFSWRIDLISVELGYRFLPEKITYIKHILDG